MKIICTCLPSMTFWRQSFNGRADGQGRISRPVIGRETLTMQAFPWQQRQTKIRHWIEEFGKVHPNAVAESVMRDLGGNAACGTVLGAVVTAAQGVSEFAVTSSRRSANIMQEAWRGAIEG